MLSRPRFPLPFALLLLVGACTSQTVVKTLPGAEADGGNAEAPVGPSGAPCAEIAPTALIKAEILGQGAVDLAGENLGFAYVDVKGSPTVQILVPEAADPATVSWPTAVEYGEYGAGNISTSLSHNGDRFGFGWYSERPFGANAGVWSTRFATVSMSGERSSATNGNDDHGRRGTTDMVLSTEPHVMPRGNGFLLAWSDTRTKEPTTLNVNLANWIGIYGRVYDSNGTGAPNDVQIAQPTRMSGFSGVTDGNIAMPIWTRDDGEFHTTIHARPAVAFTPAEPAEPAAPLATFDNRGPGSSSLSAARGPDGLVLVAATRKGANETTYVGTMMIDFDGNVKTPFADWKETGIETVAVAATESGYVVAAQETSATSSVLRFFWLDASGARVGESRTELSLPTDTRLMSLTVSATNAKAVAAFIVTPSKASNDPHEITVQRATACASAAP